MVWDAEAKGSERAGISRTKTDRKDTGLVGRIIKIHKITDAVAISDALLTLAIQSRPRDACKFSSGGRSLATFFVECHCVYCGPIATSYSSASRAHTPHPSKGPPRITLPVVIRLASHSRQQIPSPSATHCHHYCLTPFRALATPFPLLLAS